MNKLFPLKPVFSAGPNILSEIIISVETNLSDKTITSAENQVNKLFQLKPVISAEPNISSENIISAKNQVKTLFQQKQSFSLNQSFRSIISAENQVKNYFN